jgi:hypothetical protein
MGLCLQTGTVYCWVEVYVENLVQNYIGQKVKNILSFLWIVKNILYIPIKLNKWLVFRYESW